MKTVYFVRHGESESNANGVNYGASAMLSAKGKEQARKVAVKFNTTEVDSIISSSYPRALQTAEIIASSVGRVVEECGYFHELRKPTCLTGLKKDDTLRKEWEHTYIEKLLSNDTEYRYADEESFADLLVRARSARDFLERHSAVTMMVVTHGRFLRFLHAFFVFGDTLTPSLFARVLLSHKTSNTGITVYEYASDACAPQQPWAVRTWMDVAHLSD
ncbi:MAG: histidine phosphatase family protein [Candidatus Pacebacteria bacterium]|nr:histidine phosphatase family protein [Candidatus Paceibacterota bacterium]